jgi:hypothetical protein
LVHCGADSADSQHVESRCRHLLALPQAMRAGTAQFDEATGGLHAAAFDRAGDLWVLREEASAGTTPWTRWWAGPGREAAFRSESLRP